MQRATITGIRIRSPSDARVIFHAVYLNVLPMVTRRLDTEERSLISSGAVYVWEERGQHTELTGVGIERWTDGIRWGPSRVREGFLFYHEKPSTQQHYDTSYDPMRSVLIKQTYTVYVNTRRGQRKWHLIAYFTEDTVHRLRSIDDIPELASLSVPAGRYISARSAKGRAEHSFASDSEGSGFTRLEYVPYAPPQSIKPDSVPQALPAQRPYLDIPRDWPMDSEAKDEGNSSPSRSTSPTSSNTPTSDERGKQILVPLSYLEERPPPRRHPTDEKVLMLLTSKCMQDKRHWLRGGPTSSKGRLVDTME